MGQGIYLNATTSGSGKTLVALGIINLLQSQTSNIGFFRPITETSRAEDLTIKLIEKHCKIDPHNIKTGISKQQVINLLAEGKHNDIYQQCVSAYSDLSQKCDIIIVESSNLENSDTALEFELNATLANHLGTPILSIINAKNRSYQNVIETIELNSKELVRNHNTLLTTIVNRASYKVIEELKSQNKNLAIIPEIPELDKPTIDEVVQQINATQIGGSTNTARNIKDIRVAAMNVNNFLQLLDEGSFVITPGDRADIILTTLASSLSPHFPIPSGLLLTGGIKPESPISDIIHNAPFPVYSVKSDTYTATKHISNIQSTLNSTANSKKVTTALSAWSRFVDQKEILNKLSIPQISTITPLKFTHQLVERAISNKKHIVLPEGNDIRILKAAEILNKRNICDLTLLGNVEMIHNLAATNAIEISDINIVDPAESDLKTDFAKEYAKIRAHKGVTLEYAKETMNDPSYFGTMMVHMNIVDGMVSGAVNTTANTIRPALEFIKTKPDVSIISSVFFMCLPDRILVYGDCAVNPNPNSSQLADIAIASADTAKEFNINAKIAMLSYSTGKSGTGESVDKVRKATEEVRRRRPDLAIEGPIQYDAASNTNIAATKLPESDVAGKATTFIFPDLNTGNNTYKAVQQASGAIAIGPILQGLNKPVNDLSRGCTVEDIVNTIVITAIQAQTK